jgi:hypothetical protein
MQIFYRFHQDEPLQAPSLHVQETEWTSRVAPVPFTLQRLDAWAFDQNESPTLQTGIEHSDWQVFVAPVFVNPTVQVFISDDAFVGEGPTLSVEEDFWGCRPAPVASWPVPRIFTDDELTEIIPPIPDEDFWFNAVAPVAAYPAPLLFTEEGLVLPMPPIIDDDYWQCPTAPLQATNWLCLPYVPEPEEIPAGNLFIGAPPDVLGAGTIALVSGGGSVTEVFGAGQAGVATGEGGINE